MFQLSNSIEVDVSKAKVWATLTSFDQVAHWNPYIQASGSAKLGAEIKYSFRFAQEGAQGWTVDGQILELTPGERISFRATVGFAALLAITETYSIASDGPRTTVVHDMRCTGLISAFPIANLKRNFETILVRADAGLKAWLDGKTSKPASTPKRNTAGAPRRHLPHRRRR